jgi:hypothetical protein
MEYRQQLHGGSAGSHSHSSISRIAGTGTQQQYELQQQHQQHSTIGMHLQTTSMSGTSMGGSTTIDKHRPPRHMDHHSSHTSAGGAPIMGVSSLQSLHSLQSLASPPSFQSSLSLPLSMSSSLLPNFPDSPAVSPSLSTRALRPRGNSSASSTNRSGGPALLATASATSRHVPPSTPYRSSIVASPVKGARRTAADAGLAGTNGNGSYGTSYGGHAHAHGDGNKIRRRSSANTPAMLAHAQSQGLVVVRSHSPVDTSSGRQSPLATPPSPVSFSPASSSPFTIGGNSSASPSTPTSNTSPMTRSNSSMQGDDNIPMCMSPTFGQFGRSHSDITDSAFPAFPSFISQPPNDSRIIAPSPIPKSKSKENQLNLANIIVPNNNNTNTNGSNGHNTTSSSGTMGSFSAFGTPMRPIPNTNSHNSQHNNSTSFISINSSSLNHSSSSAAMATPSPVTANNNNNNNNNSSSNISSNQTTTSSSSSPSMSVASPLVSPIGHQSSGFRSFDATAHASQTPRKP